MIAFPCPHCQHALTRHGHESGSKVNCPACGLRVLVPVVAVLADPPAGNVPDQAVAAITPAINESARRAISPRHYIHPDDQAALENLKQIPLFESCLKAFLALAPERTLRGLNLAQKIRLGPRQLPHLYRMLPPACEVLGVDEPELFLEMSPLPNAYTMGDTHPFISITSGLVEMLTEAELRAVLAHECGHIACRHVLYHTMARLLTDFGLPLLGPLATAALPVRSALMYWYRRSELSCDRAAAIVSRGPRPVVETMVRLAGGPASVTAQVDIKEYLRQAADYEQLQESTWDKLLQGLATRELDHPLLSVRAREVVQWCRSAPFRQVLAALDGKTASQCPGCHAAVEPAWKFCKHCGSPITLPPPPATA